MRCRDDNIARTSPQHRQLSPVNMSAQSVDASVQQRSVWCPIWELTSSTDQRLICLSRWKTHLSTAQCESLEAIQCRAISIIYPVTVGMPYIFALSYAQIPSPHSRRKDANKRVFRSISHPIFLLYLFLSILPPQRDSTITSRLRSAAIYPWSATRTKRFTSSVQYFLLNYQ